MARTAKIRIVDETHIKNVRLYRRPLAQLAVAHLFLTPNYRLPPRVEIILEGLENLPRNRRVIFALNHTDRYNYWPFQYQMWRHGDLPFTTTWVKAKYYENPLLAWFFDQCNNIPLPSRGYLILKDAQRLLKRKLSDPEYRTLRDLVDGAGDDDTARRTATGDLRRLLTEARADFDPEHETYADYIHRWNDRVMGLVEQRTLEALGPNDNNVIVFPTGTRSLRMRPALPGLAQFALRHRVPIVPVGSMGSEICYPGSNPWAKGGRIVYRIGPALEHDGALAPCQIDADYRPFTRDTMAHADKIELASQIITEAIDALLDPPYKLDPHGGSDARSRAARLT